MQISRTEKRDEKDIGDNHIKNNKLESSNSSAAGKEWEGEWS